MRWKWNPESNHDNRLKIARDFKTATAISKDGRYWFKFKFHGKCKPSVNEIAIGVVSKTYYIENILGIGYDRTGYSRDVVHPEESEIYYETDTKSIKHGLGDQDEFSIEWYDPSMRWWSKI